MGKLTDAFKTKKAVEDKKNDTILQVLGLLDDLPAEAQKEVIQKIAAAVGMTASTPSYSIYDR